LRLGSQINQERQENIHDGERPTYGDSFFCFSMDFTIQKTFSERLPFYLLHDKHLIYMIDTLVNKAKGLLLNPVETFRQSRADEPGVVFTYFAALLLLNAVLSALIAFAWNERMPFFAGITAGISVPVMIFFIALAGGFFFTLILAVWLHLWVYLLGGRMGFLQTFKAIMFGNTPRLLLGWIPLIGFVFALWSLVLGILGIRELQEISTGKAILAMVIAFLIPLIFIILLAAYLIPSNMVVMPDPVHGGTWGYT
jgi:hypothetical protein